MLAFRCDHTGVALCVVGHLEQAVVDEVLQTALAHLLFLVGELRNQHRQQLQHAHQVLVFLISVCFGDGPL